MIRLKEIQEKLLHLVGWEQALNPADTIDDAITTSESGLYFQEAHPMMTLRNIKAIMPDEWDLHYPEWNMLLDYKTGYKVRHNGLVWIAKQDHVNEEPTASDFDDDYSREDYGNPYWKPYNSLSDYLLKLTYNGIKQVVTTFLQMKQLTHKTRELLERMTFFDGAGRIQNTTDNNHRIVGFEIVPVRSMGVTAKIGRIGLQMIGATGDVKLYLYHSSQAEPIKTYTLNYTKTNGGFQWFDLDDCFMPYISDTNNAGGAWYLCYYQDELPFGMEAINVSKDWSREPCSNCNIGSVQAWRELTKFLQISPFLVQAPENYINDHLLWDLQNMVYTNCSNYGLNCEVTVGCDLTDFIVSQRYLFQSAIQKQVATVALRTLAMNPDVRVNRNQVNATRMDILYELDGNTQGREGGLGYELKKAYEAIDVDTTGIDRICLSCDHRGVKYTSI